jgi:hypothetical protein
MAMVCPQCSGAYDQRLNCPKCSVRLDYQVVRARKDSGELESPSQWQQTPWGRILVGLLLAQGLYYGLRQLLTAGLLASGDEAAPDVWKTLLGLVLGQGIQAFGLLIGGVMTGAGQRRGFAYGAVVGIWNGILFVALNYRNAPLAEPVAMYGLPLLQMAFGAVGGYIGGAIWKPLPSLGAFLPRGDVVLSSGGRKRVSPFSGPIAWGRVALGTTLAVGGTLWATVILDFVLQAAEGKLTIESHLQAQLVTWEITALAMLAGAAFSGAATINPVKQGLCMGLAAASILIGLRFGSPKFSMNVHIFTFANAVALGLVGGWFGGQVFPPSCGARIKSVGPLTA